METVAKSKVQNAIERWKLAVWLPLIWLLYNQDLMEAFLCLIVFAGLYEVYAHSLMMQTGMFSRWATASYFQLTGLFWLLLFPEREIWFLVAVVIANDMFAYYGGSFLNFKGWMQKKIFPVSPNKTLGGFCYGLIGGAVTAMVLVYNFDYSINYIFLANAACLMAITGDLMNSGFKRFLGLKNSGDGLFTGKLLCGHGGVYDRFDSISLVCHFWMLVHLLKLN